MVQCVHELICKVGLNERRQEEREKLYFSTYQRKHFIEFISGKNSGFYRYKPSG